MQAENCTAIIRKGTGKKNKEFRFFLKGKNGESLANGEHYKNKKDLLKTLDRYFFYFKIDDQTVKAKVYVDDHL